MNQTPPPPEAAGLVRLDGFALSTFVSAGSEAKGRGVATRTGRVLDWLSSLFGAHPAATLFVVGPDDWNDVAAIPSYGMPHAVTDRVVTGTTSAEFWREYTDTIEPLLPASATDRLRAVYGDPPDLGGRFADLVIVHELAHLFHWFDEATGETDFPRLWLAELFANIGFYGYIATHEPSQLPVLETICELSEAAGPDPWPIRDLNDMGDSLAEGPLNYVWFELLLILIAKRIWEAGTVGAFNRFRDTLRHPTLTDDQILDRLAAIHPDIADAVRTWPR